MIKETTYLSLSPPPLHFPLFPSHRLCSGSTASLQERNAAKVALSLVSRFSEGLTVLPLLLHWILDGMRRYRYLYEALKPAEAETTPESEDPKPSLHKSLASACI
jgi:hypothetical protein